MLTDGPSGVTAECPNSTATFLGITPLARVADFSAREVRVQFVRWQAEPP